MKLKYLPFVYFFILITTMAQATTWLVGPTRTYKKPSAVSLLVQNGDTVAIEAGVYNSDTARWSADNLVLKGVGGMAHLKANGASYGGKAIWVIAGKNTTVQYIEFSLCTVVDKNGAGIRQEGINLTVQHCYFHDNEDGILAGDNLTSDILIEYSEFYNNGFGDGYSHNLYINHVNSLTFRYNYSHHAKIGHELKSRAYNNYILYNRLANEATGTASRNIDLPNGGKAIIIGNEIHQGTQTQNSNMVGYGLEGLTNPVSQFYLINNTFVNERSTAVFVSVQNATSVTKMYNNIFAGNGTILNGTSTATDTTHNLYCSIVNGGFVNATGYDYHLVSASMAINKGTYPGFAGTFHLKPISEYVQPNNMIAREVYDSLDIGAHEFGAASGMDYNRKQNSQIKIVPNPNAGSFMIYLPPNLTGEKSIQLYDLTGKLIYSSIETIDRIEFTNMKLSNGIYLLRLDTNGEIFFEKVVVST